MTFDQGIAFAILIAVIALLIWDRIRYDLVAAAALLAALAAGIVPAEKAFSGLSDDIVVIVGSALVVSAAVARSGLIERLIRPITPHMKRSEVQIVVLCTIVAVLSAFVKNIGALAMFIPIAFQLARRTGNPVSRLLMPLSFAALLGGLITQIGTSPNIIVSRLREEMLGEPFRMFDFAPVGFWLTGAGVAFLAIGWRLLPRSGKKGTSEELFSVDDYLAEVCIPPGSPIAGKTVADLEALGEGDVAVVAIIREKTHRYVPAVHWELYEGDVLTLECDAQALERIIATAGLELLHDKELAKESDKKGKANIVEVVVAPGSRMIGRNAEQLRLRDRWGVNLLAISRRGERIEQRLRRVSFAAGDLLVLRVPTQETADRLAQLGLLPLAERHLKLGPRPKMWVPAVVLAVAMVLAGSGTVSVAVAFFGAAVVILLAGALTLDEAYAAVDWPILALLAALIPVSEALRETGGTDLIAGWLSAASAGLPPLATVGLLLVAAMAITPFLNNAATVLVMAPIAASFATRMDLNPDPFLMAVAVGAACDFLTPIGHQCNTLVMGPGGYRFNDYWRLGLPLSVIVAVLGTFLITRVWPLS